MATIPMHVWGILAICITALCFGPFFLSASQHVSAGDDGFNRTLAAERDRIELLPGWGRVFFGLFGGYITVDRDAGRALYYIFAERPHTAKDAPLVLWLNGGPGCSSLGGGFMSELGPFYPLPGGRTLRRNPYSWTTVSNIVFLESPAFVGFSYSNTSSDDEVGDHRTTSDNLQFLREFLFSRFPEYSGSDLWLAGESYAGHYIPLLAEAIHDHNQDPANRDEHIRLQGFIVGNPWTDPVADNLGQMDFLASHFLMSDEAADDVEDNCNPDAMWPLPRPNTNDTDMDTHGNSMRRHKRHKRQQQDRLLHGIETDSPLEAGTSEDQRASEGALQRDDDDYDSWHSKACERAMRRAFDEVGSINIYNIYEDVCQLAPARPLGRLATMLAQAGVPAPHYTREPPPPQLLQNPGRKLRLDPNVDPCIDDAVQSYLNLPEVQQAIHANTTNLPYLWEGCSALLRYRVRDCVDSMVRVYERLLDTRRYRIMVYSGTVDAAVPATGTLRWIRSLRLEERRGFRPWYSSTAQLGGHVIDWEGLTMVLVRDAGHMVPYTQPERGLTMFTKFINGEDLD